MQTLTIEELVAALQHAAYHSPQGTATKVAFEKHGEFYSVTDVDFDPAIPATEEYDADGTDMVLLTGPED